MSLFGNNLKYIRLGRFHIVKLNCILNLMILDFMNF